MADSKWLTSLQWELSTHVRNHLPWHHYKPHWVTQRHPLSIMWRWTRIKRSFLKSPASPGGLKRDHSTEHSQIPRASKWNIFFVPSTAPYNSETRAAYNDILSSFQSSKGTLAEQLHKCQDIKYVRPGVGDQLTSTTAANLTYRNYMPY